MTFRARSLRTLLFVAPLGWSAGPASAHEVKVPIGADSVSLSTATPESTAFSFAASGQVNIFVGDHVYALVELRGDRGRERFDADLRGRLEQVFLRLTTGSGREGIQVGRFASPFGSYADRHLGVLDPFVRPPLAYDYRTVMNRWRWPGSEAGFLVWKDQPEDIDILGAPPVWDVPYQWGGMAFGRVGSVDVRAAAMNSAPSSHPNAWDFSSESLRRPSLVLAARWAVRPGIELGASYDRGPWLALNDPAVTVTPPNGPAGPAPASASPPLRRRGATPAV